MVKPKATKVSPLRVGDIVTMNIDGWDFSMKGNRGRLMRVTKVKRAMSETGFIVNVAVKDKPIYDMQGNECFELEGFDCNWFKKYQG
jgi:hypothetical protein